MKRYFYALLCVVLLTSFTAAQSSKKGGLTGWDYFKQKRYDVALELLKKDSRLYPQSHEIYDGIGWCYFFRGELDDAESFFKKALKYNPEYRYSKMGLESVADARLGDIVRGESLLAQKRYSEAISTFGGILEKRPKPHDDILNRSYRGRGYAHYYLGLYQKALKDLQKANRIVSIDAVTSAGIGFVQLARKKYSEADIAFEHALKHAPKDQQVRLSHGWCAYYSNNGTAAVRRFEKARSLFPQSWGAVYGLAWSKNRKGKSKEAAALFRKALSMSPSAATSDLLAWIRQEDTRSELLVDYGFALTEFGQYLSAQQVFRSTLSHVDRSQMLLGDALCALNQGDNVGAVRIVNSLHDRGVDPQRDLRVPRSDSSTQSDEVEISASSIGGWAHLRLGELTESTQMFEKATRLQGQWVDAESGLGYVKVAERKYLEAEKRFQKALGVLATYSPATDGLEKVRAWRFEVYDRAWALIKSGELATAKTILDGLRQDPAKRFPPSRMDLVDYSLGHIAKLEGNAESAAKLYRAALTKNPELTQASVGLGWAMVTLKEFDEAVKLLEALLAKVPADPEPRRLLARAWADWDRDEEAFKMLAIWVKEFPTDPELNDRYGRMLIEKNRRIEARIMFAAVLTANPAYISEEELREWFEKFEEFRSLYGTLGWASYNRGLYQKAYDNFDNAVKFEPGEAMHLKGLSLSASAIKKFDVADDQAAAWAETLGKTTADKAARRGLDMTLGWNLYTAGEYRRALKRFQKVEKDERKDGKSKAQGVDLLSALGWTWHGMGKPQRAREYFVKAIAREPRLETALQGLEAVNKALGN
ncbi:MAG: tetratricopeptide (TPR) repeat protein [Planctomycetota bacterium]|jgi:tetratricopeptide (TPR) repeat protein